jgi:hypothetical protein
MQSQALQLSVHISLIENIRKEDISVTKFREEIVKGAVEL